MKGDPVGTDASADERSLGEQVVGSVRWVALEKWGVRLSSLVVFAILGRLVAPSDFGLIALASVFVLFLGVFVDSGFGQTLVQRKDLRDEHADAAFWVSLGIGSVLAIGVIVIAPLFRGFTENDDLVPVLQVLSLSLPLTALAGVPAALLSRDFGFRSLALRRLAATAAGSIAGIALAVAGAGVWALVAQTLGSAVVGVLVVWRVSPWRPSFRFSTSAAKELLAFGSSVLGIELIAMTNAQADKLLVGLYFGPTELGYYYIGARIAQIMLDLLVAVTGTLSLPTFSRLQDDPRRMRSGLQRFTFVSAAIAFPAFAITAALAPEAITVLFGDQWDDSVRIMQFLAPSSALASIMWFDKGLFLGAGKPRVAFRLALIQTLVGFSLLVAALPFGVVAMAISRSVRYLVVWPIRLRALRRHLGVEIGPYVRQFVPATIAALCAAGAVAAWQRSGWAIANDLVAVTTLGTLGGLLYLALLWALAKDELLRTLGTVLGSRQPAWLRRLA